MFQKCNDLMQFLQPVSRKRDTFVFIILGGLILIILGSAIGISFFKQKGKCGLFRITRIFHTFIFLLIPAFFSSEHHRVESDCVVSSRAGKN